MNSSDRKKKIKDLYVQFFKKVGIDSNNGIFKKNEKLKFATYPYIGDRYGEKTKILFVGLTTGKDERPGYITSFDQRQKDIGSGKAYKLKYNPHIAGTLITAASFLSHLLESKIWEKIKNEKSYKASINKLKEIGVENPLSYVALTNFYKFVTSEEKNRGGINGEYVKKEEEQKLLYDEIDLFNPDVIFFQSKQFCNPPYYIFFEELKKQRKVQSIKIYIGRHPAYRPPPPRNPLILVGSYEQI